MRDTRSTGAQENILEFLKSNEFQKIIRTAVKEETQNLVTKINELEEEMTRQSAIYQTSTIELLEEKELQDIILNTVRN